MRCYGEMLTQERTPNPGTAAAVAEGVWAVAAAAVPIAEEMILFQKLMVEGTWSRNIVREVEKMLLKWMEVEGLWDKQHRGEMGEGQVVGFTQPRGR
jgi:hypothetical protein